MPVARFVSIAVVFAAALGCGGASATASDSTGTSVQASEFTLRLTTDSARIGVECPFGLLYCFTTVPSSGTKISRLVLGPQTTNLPKVDDSVGTVVEAFSAVQFEDSLKGNATVNDAGIVRVSVGPVPFNGYYDYVFLNGTITNGQFAGRWSRAIDPHGLENLGSFVTVP